MAPKARKPRCLQAAPGIRILLVDDDPEVRAVTSAYLTEMGHRVIEAPDGASAIDLLRTDREIDLLVADFAMPGMTGFDLALKAREHRQGIGILLVTGYADPGKMARRLPAACISRSDEPIWPPR